MEGVVMTIFKISVIWCFSLFFSNAWSNGKIVSSPANTDHGFNTYELSFVGRKGNMRGAINRSVKFYAIILKSATPCSLSEKERLRTQKLFPTHKVYMSRMGCKPELETMISYTNVNPDYGFMAVYGGANFKQARQYLKKVLATGKFPDAYIRRMQVVFNLT